MSFSSILIGDEEFRPQEQLFDPNFDPPSYMRVADIHSLANRNKSLFNEEEGGILTDIPLFIAASVVSGGAQLYNVLPSIGNFLGGDFEQAEIHDVLQSLDDDLGQYYQEHAGAIDTVGFILSSLVPGMAGIKGLRAVQSAGILRLEKAMESGRIGETAGKALGLLAPNRQQHVAKAISELTSSNQVFKLSNRNLLNAMAAGMGQNVLEATAFEVAVAATMFNSPILEVQDIGDLITNIAIGGVAFGAIGGVVDAARSTYTVKQGLKAAAIEDAPWVAMNQLTGAETGDRIAFHWSQVQNMPDVPSTLSKERFDFLSAAKEEKKTTLMRLVREDLAEVTKGDQEAAEQLFVMLQLGDSSQAIEKTLGLRAANKITAPTKETKKIEKALKRVKAGKAGKPGDTALVENRLVSYVVTQGESAGTTTTVQPLKLSLADNLRPGERITVSPTSVSIGKVDPKTGTALNKRVSYTFSPEDPWSLATSSVEEANARHVWAMHAPPITEMFSKTVRGNKVFRTPVIKENDIPLLDKLYREFQPGWKVMQKDNSLLAFQTKDEFRNWIFINKINKANELQQAGGKGVFLSTPEAVVDRLRYITGINFQVAEVTSKTARAIGFHKQVAEGITKIGLVEDKLLKYPLHRLVQTLKHEEGHQIFDTLLDIGGIPANRYDVLRKELVEVSKKVREDLWKSNVQKNIDYRNTDHELMADTFSYFSQFANRVGKEAPEFDALFGHLLRPIPRQVVDSYMARARKLQQSEIAAMLNIRPSLLSGVEAKNLDDALFDMQSTAAAHTKVMTEAGLHDPAKGIIETWKQPRTLQLQYDKTPVQDMDGNLLRGMAMVKEQERLYLDGTDRAFASVAEEFNGQFPAIADTLVYTADKLGSGGKFAAAASSNYGTLAATVEHIGQVTTRFIKKFQDETRETLEPYLVKLGQNQEAAIEWSTLSAKLRAIPDDYVLDELGTALIPRVVRDYDVALAAGKKPKPYELRAHDAPMEIPLATLEVRELAAAHIARNGKRVESYRTLHAAQGNEFSFKSDIFYPPPVNTSDFPFFALVEDTSIAGGIGAKRTIYAASADQLEDMMTKIRGEPGIIVRTKKEIEEFYKSRGEFQYEQTLIDRSIDSTLYRKGVSSPEYVPTDPKKIVTELLEWHTRAEADLARGAVKIKYDKQFSALHARGNAYTNVAVSTTGNSSLLRHADSVVENPFAGYERTALGIRSYQDYPWWTNTNRQLDAVVSQMYEKASGVLHSAKTPEDLDKINEILDRYGFKGAAYSPEMELLANHTAPKGALSSFVAKANSILATVVLRLDALNSINNAVGAQVLLGTEVRSVLRAINRADANAAGKLADLAHITVPGTGDKILAPGKLIARAMKNFHSNDKNLMQFYKDNGYMTTIRDQYMQTLDHLTLNGKESVKQLEGKISSIQEGFRKFADKGEKWTGNRLAEEFNRFIAADVMKQITDEAVSRKLMDSKEALAYINTFVNRTQGNYLAAQRPMLFQGPIGQAVGLFQTYQFNLMQQLLRHVGEGTARDSMTLIGLQATMYGMNGLPAFNAINTHIIGSASGNTKHRDLYDTAYGVAGKEAGDWLMYGLASNILLDPDLKFNLYVRGDINPRHVTLVPTDPASVPIVQASAKFFRNLSRTVQTLGEGGDVWNTLLQGIEHNGISRPLAGLAQTLKAFANDDFQSYSTSKKGNVIASHDLLSLANLSRIAGGRPLDEAIALDSAFRFNTYALKDAEDREILGAAIKSKLIAGGQPDLRDMEQFSQRYAENGGSQTEFNKWVMQLYRTANTSQANKITQDLSSPFNQSMQRIMGGYELKDFQ